MQKNNCIIYLINYFWVIFMYKVCKTERSKQRQRYIEHVFLSMLKNKDYEDITVSQLCISANIPRKAFYRYFDTKEDVFSALVNHTLAEYESFESQRKLEKRAIKNDLKNFFAFWITEPRKTLLEALHKNNMLNSLYKYSKNMLTSGAVDMPKFLPEEDFWRQYNIFNFAITGLIGMMLDWFHGGCVQTTEEMAELACRILSNPLFPNLEDLGILLR